MAQKYAGPMHWFDSMMQGPGKADEIYRAKHGRSVDRGHGSLDQTKYPDAVPGGYTITPQHAKGEWGHVDLPGPSTNRVGKDYDSKQPGIQGSGDPKLYKPAPVIDTTQNANAPIVTRSHNEEYVQKKQQWGDNPDVKAAADKGFDIGQDYRAGDPMAPVPAYIRPGSKEYMNRADMKVWAEANPEAAKALMERTARREQRYSDAEDRKYEKAGYTTGKPENEIDQDMVESDLKRVNGGWTQGKQSNRIDRDDVAKSMDLVNAVNKGIMKTRGEVDEARILNAKDQNPGATREEAAAHAAMRGDTLVPIPARTGATSKQIPEGALDRVMEENGMQRNQAVDIVRSEEPGAHLQMGKRFTEPATNRLTTFMNNERIHRSQSDATGAAAGRMMQPQSGLNEFRTQKAPLKYEQGNIHDRTDADTQITNDHISPERFAWEINKNIGQHMFGADYSPIRSMPQY